MSAATSSRSAFLIDADNVSVEIIEEALALKEEEHGRFSTKRCYCSADFAVKNLAFLQRHSIRAMVNVTAGKNCNDIALAIDAVRLCEEGAPALVVIVASDSDFAPLAMHLRDRGCRVEGVGQDGKTSSDPKPEYDAFVTLAMGRRKAVKAAAPVAKAARASRTGRSRASARSVEPEPPAPPPPRRLPEEVEALLAALPELASGEPLELKSAAKPLREAELLSKSATSPKLFKKHPGWFVLEPEKQPRTVRFVAAGPRK
jgi:hypothetical protein